MKLYVLNFEKGTGTVFNNAYKCYEEGYNVIRDEETHKAITGYDNYCTGLMFVYEDDKGITGLFEDCYSIKLNYKNNIYSITKGN